MPISPDTRVLIPGPCEAKTHDRGRMLHMTLAQRLVLLLMVLALASAGLIPGFSGMRPLVASANSYTQQDAWEIGSGGGHGWLGVDEDGSGNKDYQAGETRYYEYMTYYLHVRSWVCGTLWYDQSIDEYTDVINGWTGWRHYGSCGRQADAYGELISTYTWTWYLHY